MTPPLIHVDFPTAVPLADPFSVQGWVASYEPIHGVAAGDDGAEPLQLGERPDVRAAHPDRPQVAGFAGCVGGRAVRDGHLHLRLHLGATDVPFAQPLTPLVLPPDKTPRLERLRPFLRRDLPMTETPFHFNFLTAEARSRFQITDTANVSAFDYAPLVQDLIARLPDGLVLDCGAGCRAQGLPNVVNLEVVAYPSTDVLAVNEQLPFIDETFDAVISCAVLEHVKDPFAAAREIVRVTKPGGTIYADVPFLQPYHGYPNHYYNMTAAGLANLFSPACEIRQAFVPDYGTPIWALTWLINSYAQGLPPAARKQFLRLRVAELQARPETFRDEPWVRDLPAAKRMELACVTSILAIKR